MAKLNDLGGEILSEFSYFKNQICVQELRFGILFVNILKLLLHVVINSLTRGGVAQWVARLTCDRWILVSREFEPHQRPSLFP